MNQEPYGLDVRRSILKCPGQLACLLGDPRPIGVSGTAREMHRRVPSSMKNRMYTVHGPRVSTAKKSRSVFDWPVHIRRLRGKGARIEFFSHTAVKGFTKVQYCPGVLNVSQMQISFLAHFVQ